MANEMAKCIHDGCSGEADKANAPYCSAHCRDRALLPLAGA